MIHINRDSFYKSGPRYIDNCIPEEWLDGPEIDGYIKNVEVSFIWEDQGWGNRKGRIWMKIIRKEETVYETAVDFFGLAPHKKKEVKKTLTVTDAIVRKFQPADRYRFMCYIGGGGGHSLHVWDFNAVIYFEGR